MVLCWIALPVFAILGIFSARYRRLAAESLECLFKTATFRKCRSGLDDRIKSQITGKMLKFSPKMARVFYRNYKIISLIFLILFIWSAWASGVAVYNYVKYGNCYGPVDTGQFCIIDAVVGGGHPNSVSDASLMSCENNSVVGTVRQDEKEKYGPCPCGGK